MTPPVDNGALAHKLRVYPKTPSPRVRDRVRGRDCSSVSPIFTGGYVIFSERHETSDIDQSDTIGGRIGRAREASGFSVAQAARRLGVKTITWQGWENDRSEPRSNKLTMIAGALGVSPTWLLTGFGEGPSEAIGDEVQLLRQELSLIANEIASAQNRLNTVLKRLETFHSYHHVETA